METFGDKFYRHSKKLLKEKREREKEKFNEIYNKPKKYQFPDEVNMVKHFYFPKFIGLASFETINKQALAIYPAICSQADFKENEWFHLSRETIATLAGVDLSVVDTGIKNLVEGEYFLNKTELNGDITMIPLLERVKKTEGKRHFYLYKAGFVRDIKEFKGNFFIFHTCIVTSGIWSMLSPRAKALYLTMRSVAKFDFHKYVEIEYDDNYEWETEFDFNSEEYRERKWDICQQPLALLCRLAGIARSNINPVIEQLEKYRLIETLDTGLYKVFLKPKHPSINFI